MATVVLDFVIEKDRTFSKILQLFDDTTGLPVNLTGYSVRMQVKPFAGSGTTYMTLTSTPAAGIAITNATQGIITISQTAVQTAALTFSQGVYDLIIVLSGVVTEKYQGTITVLPNVTSSA
jgi:hypothetical protein